MIVQTAVLSVLLCSVWGFPFQAYFEKNNNYSGNTVEDDEFTVSSLIEKANVNVGKNLDEPLVMYGDIAVPTGLGNADPCTDQGCLWPKALNGKVYVPFTISNLYSQQERQVIIQGLNSFAQSTCIRFMEKTAVQKDFLKIESLSGCYSFVGRQGNDQIVSLSRQGCVVHGIVQHELLHALGFNHEQSRSDRDEHIRILLENVIPGMENNFKKVDTRNLGTPYDYNSVMQYHRFAFSKNDQPTMIPIPDPDVPIGMAQQMSPNDILRVNRLYRCGYGASRSDLEPVYRNQYLYE